jgi:hypothetical protein
MVAEYLIKMFGCDCLMIVEHILLDSLRDSLHDLLHKRLTTYAA